MKNEQLTRNFSISTYLPAKAIREVIQTISVQHWAMITHDKDDKATHTHVILRLNNKTTTRSIARKFTDKGLGLDDGKNVNTFVEECQSLDDMFDYLTHKNQPEKYQYSIDEVSCDDLGYWRGDYSSAGKQKTAEHSIENTAYQILCDLENGLSYREMAKRYGREFIINRWKYEEFFELMTKQEQFRKQRLDTKIDRLKNGVADENNTEEIPF